MRVDVQFSILSTITTLQQLGQGFLFVIFSLFQSYWIYQVFRSLVFTQDIESITMSFAIIIAIVPKNKQIRSTEICIRSTIKYKLQSSRLAYNDLSDYALGVKFIITVYNSNSISYRPCPRLGFFVLLFFHYSCLLDLMRIFIDLICLSLRTVAINYWRSEIV